MGTVWVIIIVIHICSLLFLYTYLRRLFTYVKKYRMPESQYTLLFGWISLSHVVFAYVFTVTVFVVSSLIFLSFAK
jgi:hypothetical protein